MEKTWSGSTPKECDLCGKKIGTLFIDGVVRGRGWGILCQSCHIVFGTGLGTGRGQLYHKALNTDIFVKVGG